MIMNSQLVCCLQSYSYKLVFTDSSIDPNSIIKTHIENPLLYKTQPFNCCNDCCVDQRDSSTMYKVIYVGEERGDKDNVLKIDIESKLEGERDNKI